MQSIATTSCQHAHQQFPCGINSYQFILGSPKHMRFATHTADSADCDMQLMPVTAACVISGTLPRLEADRA